MNSLPLTSVSQEQIDAFGRDGVVLLPEMFDSDWIELLRRGLQSNCDNPTDRARVWDRDAEGRTVFYDSQAWQGIDEYKKFIFESPASTIAAQLLEASKINFYFDAVFIRSPGTQFATPWHQDEPYWSVEGFNTCSIWMPLVSVRAENALCFVPGSHLESRVLKQYNFGDLNPDRQEGVDSVDFAGLTDEAFPDIDADRDSWGVVSWDMEPGDCVAFNSRTMHGGSGMLPADKGLEVFTTKWLGDDVKVNFRPYGMDPDHTAAMTGVGLRPGDRPEGDLYPRIWTKSAAS